VHETCFQRESMSFGPGAVSVRGGACSFYSLTTYYFMLVVVNNYPVLRGP
jgi:hypothetical protein